MNEIQKVETMTPAEAGRMIGKNAEFIRVGLRAGRFNFGTAVPPKKKNGRWAYNIIKSKFYGYIGVN